MQRSKTMFGMLFEKKGKDPNPKKIRCLKAPYLSKLLAVSSFLLFFSLSLTAQTEIPHATGTLTSGTDFFNGDIYTDSGGSAGNYTNNELSTINLCGNPGESISVNFTAFDVEASGGAGGQCWDELTVVGDTGGGDATYAGDGFDAGAGLVCTDATDGAGAPTLGPFTASPGGCLSFTFDSDGSVTQSGWEATITSNVFPPALCQINAPTNPAVTAQLDGLGQAQVDVIMLTVTAGITTNILAGGCNRFRLFDGPTNLGDIRFNPFFGDNVAFNCGDIGTKTYQVYADDDADPLNGQSGPVDLTITIADNLVPTIVCPAGPFTANTSTGTADCRAPIAGLTHPTVLENCPSPSSTFQVTYANSNQPMGNDIVMMVTPGAANAFEFYVGTTTVTYSATDGAGNTSVDCVFSVTITDDEKPTWVEPAAGGVVAQVVTNASGRTRVDVVIDCQSPTYAADLATWMAYVPTATDECDGMITSFLESTGTNPNVTAFACATVAGYNNVQNRTVFRYGVTDLAGNVRQSTNAPNDEFRLRIYEVDGTAPEATAATGITDLVSDGGILTLNTSDAWNSSPDACEVNLNGAGAPDISITATDCNTFTYTKTITVNTGTAPTFVNAATNNAAGVYEVGNYTITYDMVDLCGNMSSFTFTLVVTDNTGPVVVGVPADISIPNTDVSQCSAEVEWTAPTASDCSGLLSILPSAVGPTGQPVLISASAIPGNDLADFDVGTSVVTYTATDVLGNVSTVSFNVTVADIMLPTISCTGPTTITLGTVCATAMLPDYTGFAFPVDNCPGAFANQSPAIGTPLSGITLSNDVAPAGPSNGDQFIVTFQAEDANGNLSAGTCSITVTLANNNSLTPTLATLPDLNSNLYVQAGCGSITVPSPTAVDCNNNIYHGTPTFSNGNPSTNMWTFNFNPSGSYVITWNYDDGNGSTFSQQQTIDVINDNVAPTVNAWPNDILFANSNCQVTYDISLSLVTIPTLAAGPYNPNTFNGSYKDNCGVSSITYELTGATSSGGAIALTAGTVVTLEKGITTVTYVVTDGAGLTDTDSFTIEVRDNQAPTPFCNSYNLETGSLSDDVNDNCSFEIATGDTSYDPTVTDNCNPNPTKTIVSVTPITFGLGTYTAGPSSSSLAGASFEVDSDEGYEQFRVIWEFSDGDSNSPNSQCASFLFVFDGESPEIECQDDNALVAGNQVLRNTSDDGFGVCGYVVSGAEFDPVSTDDNCSVNAVWNSWNGTATLDGEFFSTGSTFVTWNVSDEWGNTSSCSIEIIISDDEEPVFTCFPNIVVPLPSSTTYTLDAATVFQNSPVDNCPGSMTVVIQRMDMATPQPPVFDCSDATNMPIPVQVMVTDIAGNTQTCNTSVTIQENVAPIAKCQNVTIQLDASGIATLNPASLDDGSTDACGGTLSFSASQTSFDCTDLGPNTITLTVTDESGNSATCMSTVTVEDNVDPVALCSPYTAFLDATGVVVITTGDVDGGSSDNAESCFPVTLGISGTQMGTPLPMMSLTCGQVGDVDVWLTVTDGQGLTDQCLTTVTVVDNTPPMASCLSPTVRLDASGEVVVTAASLDGGSTDNCGGALSFNIGGQSSVTLDCNNIGLNNIELTVVDVNGQSSTCTAVVEVLPENDVELAIGMESGGAGQIIDVPVTITNGLDLRSISFTIQIADPSVAIIDGFTTPLTPISSNMIGNNTLAFAWSPVGGEVDFADGDVILTLQVELVGQNNEMSDVNILPGSNPTPLVISQGCGVIPYGTAVTATNGDVFIDPNTSSTIGGTIASEDGEPQENVLVTMTGDENGTMFTNAAGQYSFVVPNGSNVTITPTSDATPIRGVDAVDLAFLVSEFISGGAIAAPYDLIAGNVIPDGIPGIQIADVSRVRGEIVSLTPTWMPQFNSFRYVSSDYSFSNANAPWAETFDEARTLVANADDSGLDFISVKMGDVNDSWIPFTSDDPDNRNDGATLMLQDVAVAQGETAQVRFTAKDFDKLIAFQSTFSFDNSAFDIIDATPIGLVNFEKEMISLQYADQGLATIIWYNHQAVSLEAETEIFEFTIQAKKDISTLEGLIDFSDAVVAPKVYDNQAEARSFDLEFEAFTVSTDNPIADKFDLFQNAPNPFVSTTNIAFTLPATQFASLSISDATGRVIWLQDGIFNKGLNQVTLTANDLAHSGVLFIKLESEGASKTKRMVLLNN